MNLCLTPVDPELRTRMVVEMTMMSIRVSSKPNHDECGPMG